MLFLTACELVQGHPYQTVKFEAEHFVQKYIGEEKYLWITKSSVCLAESAQSIHRVDKLLLLGGGIN